MNIRVKDYRYKSYTGRMISNYAPTCEPQHVFVKVYPLACIAYGYTVELTRSK